MRKLYCELCNSENFIKEDGLFVCQDCGCKYTIEEARKLMQSESSVESAPSSEDTQKILDDIVKEIVEEITPEFPLHTKDSPNRIAVSIIGLGHREPSLYASGDRFINSPDSTGGIGPRIQLTNLAGKTIKYAYVYTTPYNNVNDAVRCQVNDYSTAYVAVTGPIQVGDTCTFESSNLWYNSTISKIKLMYADIEYMDGTKERFAAVDLTVQESTDDSCAITISFTANAGGAQELWFNLDGGSKITFSNGVEKTLYLKNGSHTLNIMNPFQKESYRFTVDKAKTIHIHFKSFSKDIWET